MSSGSKIDPELILQLDKTQAGDSLVEAVVRFRPDDPKQVVPSPEQTEELTQRVLDRVTKQVGKSEARFNVFKNLGSFVVSADPDFLRELISQPEVAAAVANQQSQSVVIAPVKKSPVRVAKTKTASRSLKKSNARASATHPARSHKSGK